MSLFDNLNSDGLEEQTDRLGGGGAFESDIYTGKIKVMYAITAASGAMGVQLLADFGGREYRETIYVTDKKKQNFFTRDDKKIPLPGFTTVENICLIASGDPLSAQDVEEKIINVYDFEARKELPKAVPVLTALTGQPISLALMKVLENKSAKDGNGDYQPIAEERTINTIEAVFHPEHKLTVSEAKNGADKPAFWDAWIKRNQGQLRDKRTIKDGVGQAGKAGKPGAPPKAASAPPQAGAAAAPRKSLFGNKA